MIPFERTGVLPTGNYKLVISEIERKPGKSGYDYLVLTCHVFDSDGRPGDNQVWDNVSLSPKSKFILSSLLDATQAPTEGGFHWKALKGKVFYAVLGKETYQGRLKNTIDTFITPAMADREEDDLSGQWGTQESYTSYEDDEEEETGPKSFSWSDEDASEDDKSSALSSPDEMMEETEDIPF